MPTSKPKYREAAHPQVSANQLAQYLLAGPSARKRIVQSARWQSTAVVARYRLAREAIIGCLCDGTRSPTKVAAERESLIERLGKPGNSSWAKDDIESSILALDRYAASSGQTVLSKVTCKPVPGSVPPLIIADLRVKVTPDVILHQGDQVGAMVAMIAKGEKSTKVRTEQARTAAILVWQFAQKHLQKYGEVQRSLCVSYDVFEGTVTPPSANYVTRLKNIQDACEEIAAKWHTVPPPDDLES
ncbi:MAG: hypothetical protein ACK4K7_10490 [Allosphingosinicella sp.]|uniref:hypothetical protein n=1 Tax=Allosphingosinicella sp. TaxID=2823234 RepID=UPI0039625A98